MKALSLGLLFAFSFVVVISSNINELYSKEYTNSFQQTASLENNCSYGMISYAICINNNPQTQGKDNIVNTPIISPMISKGLQDDHTPSESDKEIQVRTVLSDRVTVPSGGNAVVEAECAPDEVVTGGGTLYADLNNEVNPNLVDGSTSDTSWGYGIQNPGPNDVDIQIYAQCAKLVDIP